MTTYLPWVRSGLAGAVNTPDPLAGDVPSRGTLTVTSSVGAAPDESGSLDIALNGPGEVLSLDRRTVIRVDPADGADEAEPTCIAPSSSPSRTCPGCSPRPARTGTGSDRGSCSSWSPRTPPASPTVTAPDPESCRSPTSAPNCPTSHSRMRGRTPRSRAWATWTPPTRGHCPDLSARDSYVRALDTLPPSCPPSRPAGSPLSASPFRQPRPPPRHGTPSGSDSIVLPVFHSWRFMTGLDGDFESLVSRLKRTSLGGDTATGRAAVVANLPAGVPDLEDWRFPGALGLCPDPLPGSDFRAALSALVDRGQTATGLPLPPPLYGRWHAAQQALTGSTKQWLRRLNFDPRYRAAASLGTRIVQDNQEALMVAAWQQIGAVEEANALLRQAQLARDNSTALHATLTGLDAATLTLITGPLHTRVLDTATRVTIAAGVSASRVPASMTSAAFRRMLRPRGPLGRRAGLTAEQLLRDVNDGTPVVPTRRTPDGLTTLDADNGADDPRWCTLTPQALAERKGNRPPHVNEKQWTALLKWPCVNRRDAAVPAGRASAPEAAAVAHRPHRDVLAPRPAPRHHPRPDRRPGHGSARMGARRPAQPDHGRPADRHPPLPGLDDPRTGPVVARGERTTRGVGRRRARQHAVRREPHGRRQPRVRPRAALGVVTPPTNVAPACDGSGS